MSANLQDADSRALYEPFAVILRASSPSAALAWLVGVLATQSPNLRASNSFLVAYTGCPDAIDWLEATVASPVTTHWGQGAALLGTPWPRIRGWLLAGGSQQLMALDTLIAYRAPAPNMAPLAKIAAPVLPDAPSLSDYEEALMAILNDKSTPRIRKTVENALAYAPEILSRKTRGVSVSDLSLLYLQPDLFQNASEILSRHDAICSDMRQSIQDVFTQFRPRV